MFIIIGVIIVFASTIIGFMMAGGNPIVLVHASEFVVILGMAFGVLVIATPIHVIKEMVTKFKVALVGKTDNKENYIDLMKMLYEIFMIGRRSGLIALEEHVMNPGTSAIFNKYPAFTANHERMEFLINGLKPVIDGKIKPDQLEALLTDELNAKAEEATHPVHAFQMVGDALPAIGIVAAVLGIVVTMSAISGPVEVIGEKVGAALTGTFLGILAAYGFLNPLATGMEHLNGAEARFFYFFKAAVVASAKGFPPIVAVEFARRAISAESRPTFQEMETACTGKAKE